MSDYFIKFVPNNPFCKIDDKAKNDAINYLKTTVEADNIKLIEHENLSFIDCGGQLERIVCPICNKEISFAWWGKTMSKASENNFINLEIKTPCCNSQTTLNELKYYYPCAFSLYEFVILNPKKNIDDYVISEFEKILENPICVIEAHM